MLKWPTAATFRAKLRLVQAAEESGGIDWTVVKNDHQEPWNVIGITLIIFETKFGEKKIEKLSLNILNITGVKKVVVHRVHAKNT